jgi:L-malate glycosyltransferase
MAEQTHGYAKLKNKPIRRLLRHPLVALAAHWFFQSLFYMDRTERWFKLGLDAGLTLIIGLILSFWLFWPAAWLIAFLLAHTLNFLLNGQLWGVLKHYDLINQSDEAFIKYAQAFKQRAEAESALQRLAIYGSVSHRQWSPSSDLDARLIRYPGLMNGLRACWFLTRERTRALLSRFPLDVYILDSEHSLQKLNPEEQAIDLARKDKIR